MVLGIPNKSLNKNNLFSAIIAHMKGKCKMFITNIMDSLYQERMQIQAHYEKLIKECKDHKQLEKLEKDYKTAMENNDKEIDGYL